MIEFEDMSASDERIRLDSHSLSDTAEGYAIGRADTRTAGLSHRYEVIGAVKSWKGAQSEHAHTSFYGIAHIRRMRAYWLGVLRLQRDTNEGFHTHH